MILYIFQETGFFCCCLFCCFSSHLPSEVGQCIFLPCQLIYCLFSSSCHTIRPTSQWCQCKFSYRELAAFSPFAPFKASNRLVCCHPFLQFPSRFAIYQPIFLIVSKANTAIDFIPLCHNHFKDSYFVWAMFRKQWRTSTAISLFLDEFPLDLTRSVACPELYKS